MRSDLTRTLERIENAVAEHRRVEDAKIFFVSGPEGADGAAFLRAEGRTIQPGDVVVKFVAAQNGRPVDTPFVDLTDQYRHRAIPDRLAALDRRRVLANFSDVNFEKVRQDG